MKLRTKAILVIAKRVISIIFTGKAMGQLMKKMLMLIIKMGLIKEGDS
jgi:hypothetical protein